MTFPWGSKAVKCLGVIVFCLSAVNCGGSDRRSNPIGTGGAPGNGAGGSDAGEQDAEVPPISKAQIGEKVFDESRVQSYYVTFSDAEYARLMDFSTLLLDPYTVNEERYVQASLKLGDTELPAIGVRIKGNYSVWGCVDFATGKRVERVSSDFGNTDVCARFSLKLDIDHYDDTARLDGLKKLNLHAMAADPSKMRERLGYSLFRDMDIIAPRAVHARVYINGAYEGLFAVVENIDGRFTANRFPTSGNGNLYRDLWPSPDITSQEAEESLRTNDEPGVLDVSDFMSFRDAIVGSTEADFATRMIPYLDLDYLARYIVVDRAINNFDGIMSFYFGSGPDANQNYNWYHGDDGRFILFPWDLDKALWYPEPNFWSDNAPNGKNIVPNWNVVTNDCSGYVCSFDALVTYQGVTESFRYGVREIDCDPFLRLLRGVIYDRQKAIAEAFITGPFSEQSVTARLRAWQTQIAEAIKDDPLVDAASWQSGIDYLQTNLPHFQGNLRLMMDALIHE